LLGISQGDVNQTYLANAESQIDNAIADFYEYGFSKALPLDLKFKNATIATNTITIEGNYPINYLSRSIARLASNAVNVYIDSSTSTSNSTTLTTSQDLTPYIGTEPFVVVRQIAKMPFLQDTYMLDNEYQKFLPAWLEQAVVDQYNHQSVLESEGFFEKNRKVTSEQVRRSNYSLDYADSDSANAYITALDFLAPSVLTKLESLGLTTQTI
jgi:hypothetical protein